MGLAFRSVASSDTAATPASFLTVAKPVDIGNGAVVNGDMLRCYVLVYGAPATLPVMPGWGIVKTPYTNQSATIRLYVFGRQARTADPAAGWTVLFDNVYSAIATIVAYYDTTGGSFARVCSTANFATNAWLTHDSPEQVSNVANQWLIVVYCTDVQETWTQDAAVTERFDGTTITGAGDACMSIGDLALGGTGNTGVYTASLDAFSSVEAIVYSEVLTQMGVSQPLGTYGAITIHDSAKMQDATAFHVEELHIGFPADVSKRTAGVRTTYDLADPAGAGALTIGLSAGQQPTLWQDKNVTLNLNSRALNWFSSGVSNWSIEWGTEVGGESGVEGVEIITAGALNIRGNHEIYGGKIESASTVAFTPGASGLTRRVIGVKFVHAGTSSGAFTGGTATFPLGDFINNEFEYESETTQDVTAAIFAENERGTKFTGSVFRALCGANTANAFRLTRPRFRGTPNPAVFRLAGSAANTWRVFGGDWEEGIDKLVVNSSGNPTLANAFIDGAFLYVWLTDSAGAALSGKRIKATDTLGNVLVNVLTDANGQISFAFEEFDNGVPLVDWYAVALVETPRHRSPVKLEVNPVGDVSYDAAYESITIVDLWPEWKTYDINSGKFPDRSLAITLGPPTAPAGTEVLYADIPLAGPGEVRYESEIPEIV